VPFVLVTRLLNAAALLDLDIDRDGVAVTHRRPVPVTLSHVPNAIPRGIMRPITLPGNTRVAGRPERTP
jgi:hypothetical protein